MRPSLNLGVCLLLMIGACVRGCRANSMFEKGIVVGYLMAVGNPRTVPPLAIRRSSLPAIIPKDSDLRNQVQILLHPTKTDKKKATLKLQA